MKKRFALLDLLLIVLMVGAAVVAARGFFPSVFGPDKVTWQNYVRIEDGMTDREVRSVLGRTEDKRERGKAWGAPPWVQDRITRVSTWHGAQGRISVGYDEQDRVCWKLFLGPTGD